MNKDMMQVFFVYDTVYCKADEDDPKDAVVYFFPAQAMENQRYSLCCQLVGIAKFFKATFSSPSVAVLDQGKFAFHWSGKYLLVLGGSLDVTESILKKHLSFLCGIFCFYHGSVNTLLKECKSNREEFLNKMELSWSRYITLSRCFDNLLQLCLNPLPLTIYKKHSNAIVKANQLLHLCQLSSSVLAGAVFCNSRVLSSQLTPELTSFLTLMSNANAASPVSSVSDSTVNLPPDVELKYVYLSKKVMQNILKYNHIYAGSRFRVKTSESPSKQPFPLSHCCDESSGSEGDVDSGNCSENMSESKSKTDEISEPAKANNLIQNCLKSLSYSKGSSCCHTHIGLYERNLYKNQNHNCVKLLLNCKDVSAKSEICESKGAILQSKIKIKRFTQNVYQSGKNFNVHVSPINLLCRQHACVSAETFVAKVQSEHLNLTSSCDLEFACYMCVSHQPELHINTFSLKQWNSDVNILEFVPLMSFKTKPMSYNSHRSLNSVTGIHNTGKGRKVCKIQVLKCRSKKDRSAHTRIKHNFLGHTHSSKYFAEDSLLYDSKEKGVQSRSKIFHFPTDFCDKPNNCENVESNELEKTVLYVQRCGINTLLLFINKNYNEEILTYLWNCGFSLLKDLEYEVENKTFEECLELEPSYYILFCNNIQKTLKEHPLCPPPIFTEYCSKESVQVIQEDFLLNPDFHMISLLTRHQNIFACQTKQHSAFYLQADMSPKKAETLSNLSKKAVRRLDKFLKIS